MDANSQVSAKISDSTAESPLAAFTFKLNQIAEPMR
jgi:hypothetical protein